LADKKSVEAHFLQALIQNSAAQIKIHVKNFKGAKDLSENARKHLTVVLNSGTCDAQNRFMGIDIKNLIENLGNKNSSPQLDIQPSP